MESVILRPIGGRHAEGVEEAKRKSKGKENQYGKAQFGNFEETRQRIRQWVQYFDHKRPPRALEDCAFFLFLGHEEECGLGSLLTEPVWAMEESPGDGG